MGNDDMNLGRRNVAVLADRGHQNDELTTVKNVFIALPTCPY